MDSSLVRPASGSPAASAGTTGGTGAAAWPRGRRGDAEAGDVGAGDVGAGGAGAGDAGAGDAGVPSRRTLASRRFGERIDELVLGRSGELCKGRVRRALSPDLRALRASVVSLVRGVAGVSRVGRNDRPGVGTVGGGDRSADTGLAGAP